MQEWWTHLWLNEGFASWIEYLAVDHCFPEWDVRSSPPKTTQFENAHTGNVIGAPRRRSGRSSSSPILVVPSVSIASRALTPYARLSTEWHEVCHSVPTSHNQQQVEVEVADAAEIDEIFDIISYSKGCSIVRMLASFLGNDVFKKGLNIYLNRHKYANALTEVPTQLCHPLGFYW